MFHCSTTQVLDIGACVQLTDWGLRSLNRMSQLRVLRLDHIPALTVNGMRMLLVGESDSPATTGTHMNDIDLTNCIGMQPDPCLRLLAERASSLTRISIQGVVDTEIDWKPMQVLVKACKGLRHLKIGPGGRSSRRSENEINGKMKEKGRQGQKKIKTSINLPDVTTKAVSSSLGTTAVIHWPSTRALGYLAKYLRSTLLHLDLSGTTVRTSSMEQMKKMNRLLTLNLSECLHLNDGIFAVLPNWKLESLNISGCTTLTGVGLQDLHTSHELKHLDVSGCSHMDDVSLCSLLLTHLPNLVELECDECPLITYEGA